MNFTITVPEGSTNHNTQNLLCTPPKWTDYIAFFAANYFAHAATLTSRPGETLVETVVTVLCALFIPGSGAIRSLRSLFSHAALASNELDRAGRAGALCTVVKFYDYGKAESASNMPYWRDVLEGAIRLSALRKVHGRCKLPKNHILIELPPGIPLRPYPLPGTLNGDNGGNPSGDPSANTGSGRLGSRPAGHNVTLAHTYNLPKVLVGLFQVVWGAITLYKSRGDQIDRYGYAAFGLTVTPYVFMSLMNIFTALLSPEYPTMYLVHNPAMDAFPDNFDGIVAAVDVEATTHNIRDYTAFKFVCGVVVSLAPIAIVGGLTKFSMGESTPMQRGWIIAWLITGAASSHWVRFVHSYWLHMPSLDRGSELFCTFISCLFLFVPLWAPAVGGLVTVGLMLQEYGVCIRLDV